MSDVAWSVVVPTYRRPRAVVAAARAAAALEPPPGGHEVVVVDDGGGEPLAELVELPGVRVLRQANAGPAAARNAGAAAARGRYVAFLDDDCRPDPRWLVALDRAVGGREDVLAGGRTVNAVARSALSAASQDLVDALYRRANADPSAPRFFTSNNVGLSASGLRAVGGFDASFPLAGGEDRALCHAWRASGRRLAWAPDALVWHHHELDAPAFWRQHFRYGRGARRFYRALDESEGEGESELRERGLVGAARFGLEVVLQPLRSEHPGRRLRRALALAIAQVATAAGSLAEARAERAAEDGRS